MALHDSNCDCDGCMDVRDVEEPAADPAQSAPSAEPIEKFLYERLGFTFKAINSSLTVTIFRPEFKIFSFSQYDGKWDVVYLMDDAWKLLVELAAEKQTAALRTAQLERELADFKAAHQNLKEALAEKSGEKVYFKTRAETAESALRDAKNDAIKQCIEVATRSGKLLAEQESEIMKLMPNADGFVAGGVAMATRLSEGLRALLTVAAQTPEEK